MPDLTEADVREYLRQAEMATPGPWIGGIDSLGLAVLTGDERGRILMRAWCRADADFAAASRTMGPALAESWLQQRAEIGRLRAAKAGGGQGE